jgi:hypothetical protein
MLELIAFYYFVNIIYRISVIIFNESINIFNEVYAYYLVCVAVVAPFGS